MGRSALQLAATRSTRFPGSTAARTSVALMIAAATYQSASSARTTTATGAIVASTPPPRRRDPRGSESASLVIGVSQAQSHAHPLRDGHELRRLADFEPAL